MLRLARFFPALAALTALALAGCSTKAANPLQCGATELLCNGACVNFSSDVNNCGGCNTKCPVPAGGAATCVNGLCGGSCTAPGALCKATSSGGTLALACTDTSKDPENCGACGSVCAPQQTCTSGQCTNCPAGQLQCPVAGSPGVTQCLAVQSDNANCGGCGVVCAAPSSCQQGSCVGPGLSNCGNADGGSTSQVDVQNDPKNCGACGNACTASEVCSSGDCLPCPYGQCGNHCVDMTSDSQNCGACAKACTGTQQCVSGACASPIAITVVGTAAQGKIGSNGAQATTQVRVDSALPVETVTMNVSTGLPDGGSQDAGFSSLSLISPSNETPTFWGSNPVTLAPDAGAHLVYMAIDVGFRPDAGDVALHRATAAADVVALPPPGLNQQPVVTFATSAGVLSGKLWLPMNSPAVTLTASLDGGAGTIANVQFVNAVSGFTLGVAPVDGGVASLTVPAGDLTTFISNTTIQACAVDQVGQGVYGSGLATCQTDAGVTQLVVGRIPVQFGQTPPLLTALADGGSPTILYGVPASSGPVGYLVPISATDAQPGLPQTSTFTNYDLSTVIPAEVASAALVSKGNGASIDRFDCAAGTCTRSTLVTPGSGVTLGKIYATTGKAILARDTSSGQLQYAFPTPAATVAAVGPNGFPVTMTSGKNTFATLNSGGIVFASQSAATAPASISIKLVHPAVGVVTLATFAPNAAAGPTPLVDLSVAPTGEIVWQYTDSTAKGFVQGAFFDGATAPTASTPVQTAGGATSYGWTVVRPQIVVGVGSDNGTAGPPVLGPTQRLWIGDLGKKKFTAPGQLFSGVGDLQQGIRNRQGTRDNYSISDDQLKILWASKDSITTDPTSSTTYTLWLTDLANSDSAPGTSAIYSSPNLALIPYAPNSSLGNSPVDFAPHFVHTAAATTAVTGGAPAGGLAGVPAVIFAEEYTNFPGNGSSAFQPARMFYALYKADTTAPAPIAVDRLGQTSNIANANPGAVLLPTNRFDQDSAAGAQLLFVGYQDQNLYSVPLTGTGSSTLVSDKPYGFQLREDKQRLLVLRGDGVLLAGKLQAGQNPAAALQPIAEGLLSGPPPADLLVTPRIFGFTPDGDHAWAIAQAGGDLGAINNVAQGELVSYDLNGGARVNFGAVAFNPLNGSAREECFLANATTAIASSRSPTQLGASRLWAASSATAPAHVDLLGGPTVSIVGGNSPPFIEACAPSLDGSEALVFGERFPSGSNIGIDVTGAGAASYLFPSGNPVSGDSVLFYRAPPTAPATYSPFGGPYLDEYDLLPVYRVGSSTGTANSVASGTIGGGAKGVLTIQGSYFKVWGEAGAAGKGFPFVSVSVGFTPTPASTPSPNPSALTRPTEQNAALLFMYQAPSDTSAGYVMELPLAGKPAPARPLP